MSKITREQLDAYIDDALAEAELTEVERALRDSEQLRRQLRALQQERERGDHSIAAIWRGERVSCPTRELLGSYLLLVLEEGQQDYIEFHLNVIGCAYCRANLADLKAMQQEQAPKTNARRRRFFESSAGYLPSRRASR
jgi:hypothetical protein